MNPFRLVSPRDCIRRLSHQPWWGGGSLLLAGMLPVLAAEGPAKTYSPPLPAPPPVVPQADPGARPTNVNLRVISPGVFDLNGVVLDQNRREVRFAAALNGKTSDGPQEYLLVAGHGRTHESILRTEASPQLVHMAMLLLGAKGAGTAASTNGVVTTNTPIRTPGTETVSGDRVTVRVAWGNGADRVERPAEELVFNVKTKAALEAGKWTYNGSLFEADRFAAQVQGQLVSLVTDPYALINFTGAGHEDDTLWQAKPDRLPPAQAELEITIHLLPAGR